MTITDETIDYVGILAKLELSPEEKEQAKKDMFQFHFSISRLVPRRSLIVARISSAVPS